MSVKKCQSLPKSKAKKETLEKGLRNMTMKRSDTARYTLFFVKER